MLIISQQDGIKFSTSGDIGTANVTVRHTTDVKKLVRPGVRCWASSRTVASCACSHPQS